MYRRQFKLRRELIRHHHRRQIALLLNAGVKGQSGTEKYHAVDLFGDDEIKKGFFFLVLMGAIANQHQIPLFCRGHFDTADNFTEEGIANIRDNHQNRTGFIAFYISPHRLREITHFKRGLFNPATGRLGDFIGVH